MPQVQRIIDYMEDALVELEEAAGLSNTPDQSRARPARKTRNGAEAKTKSKVKPKRKPKTKPKAPNRM